jgi:hypothetical protein
MTRIIHTGRRGWRSEVLTGRHRFATLRAGRRDQGDVPGWVLITVMTAGLVSALWLVAGPALVDMFSSALGSVSGRR